MDLNEIARKLEGLQTVSSISKILNIKKRTSINYIWQLRKKGYLTTSYGKRKIRLYKINSLSKKTNGYNFYELLNKYSKIKLFTKEDYIIHSAKKPSVEEILARGIASKEFRVVLSSLGLFNKIKNWSIFKFFANKYNIKKKVGALYDVARSIMRVKRMDKRIRKSLFSGKGGYIIPKIKTRDFKDVEKLWNVFIPFNKQDLEVYKE